MNLKFYRIKKHLSQKDLASKCNLDLDTIRDLENGSQKPTQIILTTLASTLGVRVSDFLAPRRTDLVFQHEPLREDSTLSNDDLEWLTESVEEYFGRFYTAVDLLGGDVLPEAPKCHAHTATEIREYDAKSLRWHLGLRDCGPVLDLVGILENRGILVYPHNCSSNEFVSAHGFVNSRPYIAFNQNLTPEQVRLGIAHELVYLFSTWPKYMNREQIKKEAVGISETFLLSRDDLLRELGEHRSSISKDMEIVCCKYGVPMRLLANRALETGIVNAEAVNKFNKILSSFGWRLNEPQRIANERPVLFEQLVCRAVNEHIINIHRGAELLKLTYCEVMEYCLYE